jgi:hypothetical protein
LDLAGLILLINGTCIEAVIFFAMGDKKQSFLSSLTSGLRGALYVQKIKEFNQYHLHLQNYPLVLRDGQILRGGKYVK